VVYGDFHIFKVWDLHDKPALVIAMDVLGAVSSLGIDFKNQDIYLTNSKVTTRSFAQTGVLASPSEQR
jgi:hypothetical protein